MTESVEGETDEQPDRQTDADDCSTPCALMARGNIGYGMIHLLSDISETHTVHFVIL